MKYRVLLYSFGLLLITQAAWSCRKKFEPAQWDVDAMAPLAHGSVNFADLSKADELQTDPTGLFHIVYSDTLLRIGLDTLIGIPDTTLEEEFSIPLAGVQLNPGIPFFTKTTETRYKLKQVELTYAEIRESSFEVKVTNTFNSPILVRYRITSATLNGEIFSIEEVVPARGVFEGQYNLNGYDLDLRGINQDRVNAVVAEVEAMIDPNVGTTYMTRAGDKFTIENTFTKIIPEYATGFFGAEKFNYTDETPVDLLSTIDFKRLDIQEFDVSMVIDNGIGADLRLTIENLASRNVVSGAEADLDHYIVGQVQQFGRAVNLYQPGNPVKHISKTISFTAANSNLDELIELKPTSLFYDMTLEINPLGNISLGNDFVYYGHDLSATMFIDIPLKVGIEGLTLQDTFAFSFIEEREENRPADKVNSGYLNAYFENYYPIETQVQLYLLDGDSLQFDSLIVPLQSISAATPDSNGRVTLPAKSKVSIPVGPDQIESLRKTAAIRLKAVIDTYNTDVVRVYDDGFINFKLVGDINFSLP